MSEYKFGTIGKKKVSLDGRELKINNNTIITDVIKCAFITPASLSRNGTVYFSIDGHDVDNPVLNKFAFMYVKSQKEQVDELLSKIGIEVKSSIGSPTKLKNLSKSNEIKEKTNKMDQDGIAYCPKCHSTSLTAQKKGFGIGKAVVGASVTGGIGLVAGNIGAKKIRITCLKCGHQFWAGK